MSGFPDTLARIRRLPRNARLLLGTNALSAFGAGMVLPFLWEYLTRVRHFPTWVPATALAVQAGAAVIGGLLWGVLLDRLPYRRAVPLANVVAAVGTFVYAFASAPWISLVAAAVWGVGINGVGTSVRAAYAACTEPDQRQTAYSADYGLLNLGMGFGVLAGGALAAADFAAPTTRYAVLYGIDALTYLAMALATWGPLPGRTEHQDGTAGGPRAARGYLAVLRHPGVAVVLLLLACNAMVTFGQFRAGLPGYLLQTRAISAVGLSGAFALNIILCAAVQFLGMPMLEKRSPRSLLAASGLSALGCWALVYLAGQHRGALALTLACGGVALLSVSEALAGPLLSTQLNAVVGEELRGRANALFSTTVSAAAVVAPLAAGGLLAWDSGVPLIVLMVLLSVLSVPPALRLLAEAPATAQQGDGDAERTHDAGPAAPETTEPQTTEQGTAAAVAR